MEGLDSSLQTINRSLYQGVVYAQTDINRRNLLNYCSGYYMRVFMEGCFQIDIQDSML